MASTNIVKWNDTDNRLTAYCSDDSGETEIGPAKWDDTNNKLEINCDSTDFQVKWDDTGNNLEAQSVDDGCCATIDNCCNDKDASVTFSGIDDCGDCSEFDCETMNDTFVCENVGSCTGYDCCWRYISGDTSVHVKLNDGGLIFIYIQISTECGSPTYPKIYCFRSLDYAPDSCDGTFNDTEYYGCISDPSNYKQDGENGSVSLTFV